VIDNVVGVQFEYFGDPNPPIAPKPPMGIANCLYDDAQNLVSGTRGPGDAGRLAGATATEHSERRSLVRGWQQPV
jgi:hypothetical protein